MTRCEGCGTQRFRGILSQNWEGHEYPADNIERCDVCGVYGSDDVAREAFDLLMWVQAVIDGAEPDDRNGPNVECMAQCFTFFLGES